MSESKQEASTPELKIVRPAARPLSEWVEGFVLGLGIGAIDMAKREDRERLSKHAERFATMLLTHYLHDLQSGAIRGMKQTLAFALDPKHAETVKSRRKAKAERKKNIARETKISTLFSEQKNVGKLQ